MMNSNDSLSHRQLITMLFLSLWTVLITMIPVEGSTNSQEPLAQFTVTFVATTSSVQPYARLIANLDASYSQGPNGERIVDYHWQISTGESLSGKRVTLEVLQPNSYTVDLTVTDEHDHTSSNRQVIHINQIQEDSHCSDSDALCVEMSGTFEITVTDSTGRTLSQQTIQVQQSQSCQPTDACAESSFELDHPLERALLNFVGLKPSYHVGEVVRLDLQESFYSAHRSQKIDLWVMIETPDHSVYFLLDHLDQPFSATPQAFKTSIDHQAQYHLLDYKISPGLNGVYTFYAFYNQPDANLDHLTATQRSNWTFAVTQLGDHP